MREILSTILNVDESQQLLIPDFLYIFYIFHIFGFAR